MKETKKEAERESLESALMERKETGWKNLDTPGSLEEVNEGKEGPTKAIKDD